MRDELIDELLEEIGEKIENNDQVSQKEVSFYYSIKGAYLENGFIIGDDGVEGRQTLVVSPTLKGDATEFMLFEFNKDGIGERTNHVTVSNISQTIEAIYYIMNYYNARPSMEEAEELAEEIVKDKDSRHYPGYFG